MAAAGRLFCFKLSCTMDCRHRNKTRSTRSRAIRDFSLEPNGIQVGEPLKGFRGVLTGVPIETGALLKEPSARDVP